MIVFKKFHNKTLNLLTNADISTDTKTDRNDGAGSYYPVVGTTSGKGATSFEASSW